MTYQKKIAPHFWCLTPEPPPKREKGTQNYGAIYVNLMTSRLVRNSLMKGTDKHLCSKSPALETWAKRFRPTLYR